MKSFEKIENIRDIRKKLGLNQMDFWSRIGVTQSGGSRYESGRNMPNLYANCCVWYTSSVSIWLK